MANQMRVFACDTLQKIAGPITPIAVNFRILSSMSETCSKEVSSDSGALSYVVREHPIFLSSSLLKAAEFKLELQEIGHFCFRNL